MLPGSPASAVQDILQVQSIPTQLGLSAVLLLHSSAKLVAILYHYQEEMLHIIYYKLEVQPLCPALYPGCLVKPLHTTPNLTFKQSLNPKFNKKKEKSLHVKHKIITNLFLFPITKHFDRHAFA